MKNCSTGELRSLHKQRSCSECGIEFDGLIQDAINPKWSGKTGDWVFYLMQTHRGDFNGGALCEDCLGNLLVKSGILLPDSIPPLLEPVVEPLDSEVSEPDAVDDYLTAYANKQEITRELDLAKQKLDEAKQNFLTFTDEHNFTTVKREGYTVSRSKRTFGKVVDFDGLVRWVIEQDEPRSQYMEEVFIKGSSKDKRGLHCILEDAKKTSIELGLPIDECLPDGLNMSIIDVVTVRASKSNGNDKKKPATKVGQLEQEMETF